MAFKQDSPIPVINGGTGAVTLTGLLTEMVYLLLQLML